MKKLFLFLFLSGFFGLNPFLVELVHVQAQVREVPADIHFVTISTPHFEVIVNAEQQSLGQHYANQLEKAYGFLAISISDRPEKTIVIINDKWDVTNGYATRVPYPHIMIYPTLPGIQDSLADAGDWTLELLVHEYTHILNFEPAPGTVGVLRSIFGSIMAPNILLPSWWKEGVAVHIESSISHGGRLRSSYQDAVLRALVLAEKLKSFSLADVNEVLPTWPQGMRSYLFGSVMWSQMVADQGNTIVNRLFQRHGGRVPYFVEAPAKENLGMSYSGQYKRALDETETRTQAQLQTLQESPPTVDAPMVVKNAAYLSAPAISPDGQLIAVISRDFAENRSVRIFEKNADKKDFLEPKEILKTEAELDQGPSGKIYDGPPTGSIGRVSWLHKSRKIIYDKLDWVNSVERYSDLYLFDLDSRKTKQLSKQLRAREPAISLDDQKVAFVKLSANQTALALFDLGTERAEILVQGSPGQRISFPNFLNSDEIVYTTSPALKTETPQANNGARSQSVSLPTDELWIFNLKTRKLRKWNDSQNPQSLKMARFPTPSSRGLLATGINNGVPNIYNLGPAAASAGGDALGSGLSRGLSETSPQPLTHTLTGFFSLTEDPQNGDLYVTKMTENGPWIHKIAKKDLRGANLPVQKLPQVSGLFADRYPLRDSGPIGTEVYPAKEYEVNHHLWPHYWIPFIASSANGIIFQALTSGFDPLKKHQYSVSAAWDTALNKGSFAGIYQNTVWAVPWFVQSSVVNSYFASVADTLTTKSYLLGSNVTLFQISRELSMALAMKQISYETPNSTRRGLGPSVSFTYADLSLAGIQISPENSKTLTFGATQYVKNGDDLNHNQYVLSGSIYSNKWLPARNAVMAKVNAIHTPDKISAAYGASTASLALAQDTVGPNFLMRGYLPGHFIGRNMVNTNLEYRFPIRDIYRGQGTDPFYVKRLHGALILDGVMTEGLAYNSSQKSYSSSDFGDKFWSFGAELKLETTLGYVLPVQLVVYSYLPQNKEVGGDPSVGLTIQITQSF
jgi:hypothetical protein